MMSSTTQRKIQYSGARQPLDTQVGVYSPRLTSPVQGLGSSILVSGREAQREGLRALIPFLSPAYLVDVRGWVLGS